MLTCHECMHMVQLALVSWPFLRQMHLRVPHCVVCTWTNQQTNQVTCADADAWVLRPTDAVRTYALLWSGHCDQLNAEHFMAPRAQVGHTPKANTAGT